MTSFKNASLFFASLLLLVPAVHAASLKLDFGTETSPLFPGFTRVSDQTLIAPDSDFGFVKTAPKAYNQLRPNALEGDFVYSKGKSTFQVNLPDGSYKAWFLYGNSRYGQRVLVPLPMKYQIDINGKTAVADSINGWQDFYTEKYFYRGYNYIYHANDDFYAKYVAPNFKEASAAFIVEGGKVLFTLQDIPLNALIIYPANQAAQAEDDIAYLHRELRRYTIIHEAKPAHLNPAPAYSAGDQQQGYVTYSRFPSNPPSAGEQPLAEELHSTPGTFLAQGQTANISVTILPLRDLQNVRIAVSDLTDPDSGAKIAAADITLQHIALQEVTADGSRTKSPAYSYKVKPVFIKPFPASFTLMDKGINRTLLLTVHTHQQTRPGAYEGTLTITPQNAPARKVLFKVRVLPFTLPELPIEAGRYAMDDAYYYNYYWSKTIRDDSFRDLVWAMQRKNMQWAKDMGLNAIALSDDMRGDFQKDTVQLAPDGRMVRWMDLYRDMGFKAMPWYGFQALTSSSHNMQNLGKDRFSPEWTAKYRQLIENIRDTGKARHWPEIIFYLSDELSNDGPAGGADGLKRVTASDGISGIRRIASVNGKYEHDLIGKIEIIMPNYAFPITQQVLDDIKAKHTELWLYNVKDVRFTWGYYPFRVQAKGRFQWFNSTGNCYPFDDFDSGYGDTVYSVFVAGPDGPVSMVKALEMRDGLDDLRYLTLMKSLMAKHPHDQSKGMKDATAILKEIDALNVDLRTYASGAIDAKATGFDAGHHLWSAEQCEKMRWRIAAAIMDLQPQQ